MAKEEQSKIDTPVGYEGCRIYGHAWDSVYITFLENGTGYIDTLHCMKCDAERYDEVSRFGSIARRKYKYPAGYLLAKGKGQFNTEARNDLRLRNYERRSAK